jgi:hypothetical protein
MHIEERMKKAIEVLEILGLAPKPPINWRSIVNDTYEKIEKISKQYNKRTPDEAVTEQCTYIVLQEIAQSMVHIQEADALLEHAVNLATSIIQRR